MQIKRYHLLAAAVLFAFTQAASAYMCRDENGTTSFQQDPCPERKGTSGVVAVKAEQVTEKAMQETMKRMAKTAFARDPLAAYGLLSRNLKVTVNREDRGKAKVYDFSGYAGVLKGLRRVQGDPGVQMQGGPCAQCQRRRAGV